MRRLFRLDQTQVVEIICHPAICSNAAFKLESPLKIEPEDLLILERGTWALKSNGVEIPLDGRWVSKT